MSIKKQVQNKNGIQKLIIIGKYSFMIFENADSTYDGVLGGFGKLSSLDTNYSLRFLLNLIKERAQFERGSVLDCGAGIGRISKELLCQVFKKVNVLIIIEVDIMDQCSKYIDKAKEILK